MHTLCIDSRWASRIAQIRNEVSLPTPLLRPDLRSTYRVCRPGAGSFKVQVLPSWNRPGRVELVFRERDLYVTHIDGRGFVRYDATLNTHDGNAESLNAAVMDLRSATGDQLFRKQSLIVLCVAESLRNDRAAQSLGEYIQMLETGAGNARGALPVAELVDEAHGWGQASEAIFAALAPAARAAVFAPQQHPHAAALHVPPIDPDLQPWVPHISVLKQPGPG